MSEKDPSERCLREVPTLLNPPVKSAHLSTQTVYRRVHTDPRSDTAGHVHGTVHLQTGTGRAYIGGIPTTRVPGRVGGEAYTPREARMSLF